MKRRKFVKTVSAAGLGLATSGMRSWAFGRSASEKVVVAVMGLNGRGTVLAKTFARTPNATVGYVCDVDSLVLEKAPRPSPVCKRLLPRRSRISGARSKTHRSTRS
jgi:hypothetical protein